MSELPETVDYTNEDVKRSLKRPELRLTGPNEYIEFVVRGPATKKVSGTGNLMLVLDCAPLDDTRSPRFPTIRNNINLPMRNPDVEGHRAPNTAGICHQYLHAVDPEGFPTYAKWNTDANGWVTQAGEVLATKEEAASYNEGTRVKVFDEMKRRWADPSAFEGDTFFAQVVLDKKERKYRNISNITGEVPGDATVLTADFSTTDED